MHIYGTLVEINQYLDLARPHLHPTPLALLGKDRSRCHLAKCSPGLWNELLQTIGRNLPFKIMLMKAPKRKDQPLILEVIHIRTELFQHPGHVKGSGPDRQEIGTSL